MPLRTLSAVALVAALALSSCSDEPEPKVAPEPSPSASPAAASPSSSPSATTPPPMPVAARDNSESGGVAFVRYFWDVANWTQSTGDTKHLRFLMSSHCAGCQAALEAIEDVHQSGGTIEGGSARPSDFESERLSTSRGKLLRVTFKVRNAKQVVRKPGLEDRVFPASTVTDRFVLARVNGGWRLDVWEVLR